MTDILRFKSKNVHFKEVSKVAEAETKTHRFPIHGNEYIVPFRCYPNCQGHTMWLSDDDELTKPDGIISEPDPTNG